jgi:dihydrofolate reductase
MSSEEHDALACMQRRLLTSPRMRHRTRYGGFMRKVILAMSVTLDGFTAGPNDEMDWVTDNINDEYQLWVHPVILGSGKPLFKNIKDGQKLKLVNAETYKNGVVALDYQPAGKEVKK